MIDQDLLFRHLDRIDKMERFTARRRRQGRTWLQRNWVILFAPGPRGATETPRAEKLADGTLIIPGNGPICGASCCLAGDIALEAAPPGTVFWDDWLVTPDGAQHGYQEYAGNLAGLDYWQADSLFGSRNTRRRMRQLVMEFIAEEQEAAA